MDPFFLQLVIIPFIVIGIGIFIALKVKNIWIAPIITLILNVAINIASELYHYHQVSWAYSSSWCITFPLLSLIIIRYLRFLQVKRV